LSWPYGAPLKILANSPARIKEVPRLRAATREKVLKCAAKFAGEKLTLLLLNAGLDRKDALKIGHERSKPLKQTLIAS
jgi:hypothetical protein